MTEREGTFIVLEGIDGAGKSSVMATIEHEFDDVVPTSEPSELWTGEVLRRALQEETHPVTDFFLFMSDRHKHIEDVIKPAVSKGKIVVSDRYSDSTRAYQPLQVSQVFDSEHDPYNSEVTDWIEGVMEPWNYEPDFVIYLRISVDTALERADLDEKYETRETLEQVRDWYEYMSAKSQFGSGPEYVVIDGEQPKSDVASDVVEAIEMRLDND